MSKVKELPYHQGYDSAKAGGSTKENPYWELYDQGTGNEWAFHAWLNGWSDYNNEQLIKQREKNEG